MKMWELKYWLCFGRKQEIMDKQNERKLSRMCGDYKCYHRVNLQRSCENFLISTVQ